MRVKKQLDAAAKLGVTVVTLRAWVRQPWWNPEFKTSEGYDCEAIKAANPNTAVQSDKHRHDGNTRRLNEGIKSLDLALRQLDYKERSGELVAVEWVIAFLRETESMLVASVLDIPAKLSKLVPEGPIRNRLLAEGDQTCRQILRSHAEQIAGHIDRIKKKR